MTIQEMVTMLSNKYAALSQRRNNAFNEGDIQLVSDLDMQLAELLLTIEKLKSVA